MADESYRIAFTDAVVRTGIPPTNPLYFAGAVAPMRYYYFWYILCAAVANLAHVPARDAFYASCIWAGFGLLTTVQFYTTHFFHWSRKSQRLTLALLLITGADLLPALGQAFLQPTLNGDTEWWSVDPIDAWPDSLLWVPHHVAAVLCCLVAFLFLWLLTFQPQPTPTEDLSSRPPAPSSPPLPSVISTEAQRSGEIRVLPPVLTQPTTAATLLLTATAFASATGLSVYVTFGFALLIFAWLLRLAFLRDPTLTRWLRNLGVVTAAAALLLIPFLRELLPGLREATIPQPQGLGTPTQPHLFVLSVRRLIDSELLTTLPTFAHLNTAHPALFDQSIRLLLLPPGLAMELGLYGAALILLLLAKRRKQLRPNPARDAAFFFTLVGLALTMFLSSSVITNNDFGYRAVMLPQFFLSLLTADLLASWLFPDTSPLIPRTSTKLRLLYSLAALGAAGTLYWAFLLRAWLPLVALHRPVAPNLNYATLPEDDLQIREAFDTLNRLAPANAVVAFRPIDPVLDRQQAVMVPNEFYQRAIVMDSNRQLLNAEGKCAVHFGGDPIPCPAIQQATAQLYAVPTPDAASARSFCARFGVHYLILSAWDPLWNTAVGWPLTLPTVAAQRRFRILDCQAPPR